MLKTCARGVLIGLALLLLFASRTPAQADHCLGADRAKLAVDYLDHIPLVTVRINRRPVDLILDTGAEETILTPATARRLGLHAYYGYPRHIHSLVGGVVTGVATARRFAAGRLVLDRFRVLVGPLSLPRMSGRRPGGLLGADFLLNFDVDLDLGQDRVTLFRPDCTTPSPSWRRPYTAISANLSLHNHLFFPVRLDGHRLYAFIDSGAQRSLIDSAAARSAGATNATVDRGQLARVRGAAAKIINAHAHRFARLTIGDQTVRSPFLVVLSLGLSDADIVLGDDFLRLWRVWLSYPSKRIYLKAASE